MGSGVYFVSFIDLCLGLFVILVGFGVSGVLVSVVVLCLVLWLQVVLFGLCFVDGFVLFYLLIVVGILFVLIHGIGD